MLTLPMGQTLGALMTEAEELLLQLDDPRTWQGKMPLCLGGSRLHSWRPQFAMNLQWQIGGRTATLVYPVGIVCPRCQWAIGLHLEAVDPIEAETTRQRG